MKRYLIPTVVILFALTITWPVLGQREGRGAGQGQQGRAGQGRMQGLSEEERTQMRERWQNMSEEERQQFRSQMRERMGGRRLRMSREEQLKVVEDIEEQLAKLKAAIKESPDREEFRKLSDASDEQRTKFREEWQKARQKQQQMVSAIQEQLAKLAEPRSPARIAMPAMPINELRTIHQMAVEEEAKKTAYHIERLITKLQGGPAEQPTRPAQPDKPDEQQTKPKQGIESTVSGKNTER
jgi:methionyl-tRNA synthetase